jgi:ribosomal protein S18 acetylase RimI-like enzyme
MKESINNLFSFYREVGASPLVTLMKSARFTVVSGQEESWPQMVFGIQLSKNPAHELEQALTQVVKRELPGFAVCNASLFGQESQELLRKAGIYPVKTWTLMDIAFHKPIIFRQRKGLEIKTLNTSEEILSFSSLVNAELMQSVKIIPVLLNELQAKPPFNFYGLFVDDELVSGLLTYSVQKTSGLYFIVTKTGYRGKGLAKNVIGYAVNTLFGEGIEKVVLQAAQKAVPLYTQLGFLPHGKLVIFWKPTN